MKIRFYTTNKEAVVFDLEDILKQLNIEEQVATVGLVIEKDEAEVEAIAQTIQDDYPNMYLQAKEYGRNLTLACAELPNPTNPDIVTYLYAGDDATETDSWIAKVNNTIRAQGDNSERLIHIDSNLAAVVEANETEQGYYASTVSQHDKATNEMLSFRQIAESLEAVGDNYKYQSASNILTARTKAERNYIVRLIKMYCDDTKDSSVILATSATGKTVARYLGVDAQLEQGDVTVDLYPYFIEDSYNSVVNGVAPASTTVEAYVPTLYSLIVPESVTLGGDAGSGDKTVTFPVTVKGDIGLSQEVNVSTTPPTMKSSKAADVLASVETPKTTWNRDDALAGVTSNYMVKANLTPGDWSGTVYFACTILGD